MRERERRSQRERRTDNDALRERHTHLVESSGIHNLQERATCKREREGKRERERVTSYPICETQKEIVARRARHA